MRRAWRFFLRFEPYVACVVAVGLSGAAFFLTDAFLAVGLSLLTLILFNQYRAAGDAQTESQVQLLPDELVGGRLDDSLRSADRWSFRGGTGSFLRTDTLPRLAKRSQRTGKRLPVQVEVINPSNEEACKQYVTYRRQADPHAKSSGREWTTRYIQCEIAASIVAAAYHAANSQLVVDFAFSDTPNALRFDLSNNEAVITSAYKGFPALVVPSSSEIFSSIQTDLDLSFKGARVRHKIEGITVEFGKKKVDVPRVREVLALLPAGLLPDDFTAAELAEVAKRAKDSRFRK